MRFSERYGYEKPSEVIIRERITPEIQHAIGNCYLDLFEMINQSSYRQLEQFIQRYCLNLSIENVPPLSVFDEISFSTHNDYKHFIILPFLKQENNEWWRKIDIIETTISFLIDNKKEDISERFVERVNAEFERLKFGYRIVDGYVTEITSEQEIKTIETALKENKDNVRMHLNNALKLYAQRPNADYRNSIKESISAVEALNRIITGENILNLKKMENKGLKIPPVLRSAFEKLYGYSNDEKTGIRHSLMDETGEYVPGAEEALYMLITCSAFINYLNTKLK